MRRLIYILLLVLAGFGCTERIDVDFQGQEYERLVVEATLTSDTMAHQVILSRTTNFNYKGAPPGVSNALVEIEDDDGNVHLLTENPSKPGTYETSPDYHTVMGKTYTLNITLEEAIGDNKFYTATETAPFVNQVDSIHLVLQEDWGSEGFIEVQCYYQDPPEKNFYMFNIFINDRLITDTLSERMVTDDEFYNGSYTNGIGVGWLNQAIGKEKVNPGDVVTFQAGSITEGYANFVWSLQEEVGFSTPLFSGPPANVKGNLSNGAIGYFAVYPTVYSSRKY
jgi:hypothetical protein